MAPLIYFLCALTALLCTVLLFRGFRRSGFRLLFWSGLCFSVLTFENLLLLLDRTIWATSEDIPWRRHIALVGLAMLLYGMIWEDKK
ncbi:DUF5985 family protein [Brevifollis gellanilyticus]|uniref:Uncharacterized protein n=1 Tax=Brevifollis gellanilyticus TaxID=748831 RepID=A0A512MFG8_9BACT|nr:DUF5985 family protein [Brevifollis gellanilyticus]GEP45091.1 hypothetical protein BGE01nite_43820 [Brevifollis gellanilyticus]